MSKRGWNAAVRAARWLPFFFGLMWAAAPAHGQTTGLPTPMSGDCSISASGALTCTKTNGVPFAASAVTDVTDAGNITSGTLDAARMCSGTASPYYYCDPSTHAWTAVSSVPAVSSSVAITGGSISGVTNQTDTGTNPGLGYFIKSTNSGMTTGIAAGAVCAMQWTYTGSSANYNGFASCVETSGYTYLYVTRNTPMASPSWTYLLQYNPGGGTIASNMSFLAPGVAVTSQIVSNRSSGPGFKGALITPASSTATCAVGEAEWDANYVYICTATNSWKRSALSPF